VPEKQCEVTVVDCYPGMEVPNPLPIEICQGEANIEVVLRDILALTNSITTATSMETENPSC